MQRPFYLGLVGLCALSAAVAGTATSAHAQAAGQYDIPDTSASAAFVAPSQVVAGLTFSTLTRGSGLTASGDAGTFSSIGFNFNTTDADAAKANGDFLEFTITPDAGASYSLAGFTYTDMATIPGPANIVVQSSADGFLSSLAAYAVSPDATDRVVTLGGAAFTGITSALTFRIIGFNANNPNSGSHYALQAKPLVVNGTSSSSSGGISLTAVAPEPGSLSLAALGLLPLLGIAGARRQKR